MDSNSILNRIDTFCSGLMLILLMVLILVMSDNAKGQPVSYELIQPSCSGCDDGIIDFTISDSRMVAEFTWADGSSYEDKAGIGPGTYNVQIRDVVTGELYFYSIDVVFRSEPNVLIYTDPVTCHGYANGVITVSTDNTTGDVTVSLNGAEPVSKRSFTGLQGGDHLVRVYDETGIIEERLVAVYEPAPVEIHLSVGYLECLTNSAQIDAEFTGGSGKYHARWSDGVSGGSRYHTAPGDYILTVTDENFCMATDHINIPYHSGSMRIRSTTVGESEPGKEDGVIDIEINGGEKPLSFFWSTGYRGEDLYFVGSGIYSVRIQDRAGCEVVVPVEVPEASARSVFTGLSN